MDERQHPLRRPQRGRSSTPAARTSTSTSRGRRGSGWRPTPTPSPPSPPAPSVQLHLQVAPAGLRRPLERRAGARRPAAGARAPTRRSSSASGCGPRPASSCSPRPPTPASVELKNQGVRPRVFFGERWITSIFDLFEENVRYFPALLPETSDEDPVAVLERGRAPRLSELRLHNGTVYRWNRPIYDIVGGTPAPAGREPGAAGRPADRRRPRQRGLLLRRACGCWPPRTGRSGPR